MTYNMGRQADENLPEVVPNPPSHHYQPSPLPEVVPDSSPEAGHPPFYADQQEKYPAFYDDAPKFPYEQPVPGTPDAAQYQQQQYEQQQYQQQWGGAANPISSISPNSSVPWQRIPSRADDQQTVVGSEAEPERRICGIRRRLFFIIAGILGVIVIAAAVGGGVGSAVSARAGSNSNEVAETAGSQNER
jgi:hypothetical protein